MISAFILRRVGTRDAARLGLLAAIAILPTASQAQIERAYYQSGARQQATAARHANFLQGGSDLWMNAHGERVVVPAQYCADGCGAAGYGSQPGGPGYGAHGPGQGPCPACLGHGCGYCRGYHTPGPGQYPPGGPFGQGAGLEPWYDNNGMPNYATDPFGNALDQNGPHYFDFSIEYLQWRRDDIADGNVPFVSAGINGPIAISTDRADLDHEPGFRVMGRYDLGAVSFLEFGYSGIAEWNTVQTVRSEDNIFFTPFSNFGLGFDTNGDGVPDTNVGGAGLESTEAANFARLDFETELHNAEINVRRYWVGYNPRVTGTILAGVRYTRLKEALQFQTQAVGSSLFDVRAENDLVGFQVGGDVWVTARQGLRFGGVGKIGIYGNDAQVFSQIQSTDIVGGTLVERMSDDEVALIVEGGVSAIWDICPSISLKAGYEVLFLEGIATSANNFNFDNAPFQAGTRPPLQDIAEFDALYHGFNAGLEYVW